MDTTVNTTVEAVYGADWAWAIPLIAITVMIHAGALQLIGRNVHQLRTGLLQKHQMAAVGLAATLITCLHAFEALIWAGAYRLLGALPTFHEAILYSLNAMTSYGKTNLSLALQWQLMGALESLNGWIVFGLSTAMLFSVIQRVWDRTRT